MSSDCFVVCLFRYLMSANIPRPENVKNQAYFWPRAFGWQTPPPPLSVHLDLCMSVAECTVLSMDSGT